MRFSMPCMSDHKARAMPVENGLISEDAGIRLQILRSAVVGIWKWLRPVVRLRSFGATARQPSPSSVTRFV